MTKAIIIKQKCITHGVTSFVKRRDGIFRCKKCAVEAVQRRRIKIKSMALEYKGGKCINCGYNKCAAALTFHHRERDDKEFGISAHGYTISWARVKIELDKCDLLCCRCHVEVHNCMGL